MKKFLEKVRQFFATPPRKKHPWLWGGFALLLFLVLFFFSALGSMRVFLPYYGDLTGFPFSSRQYLLVFQNNHELRPGGGFISAYGIAHFQSGMMTKLDVADVYGDIDQHPYQEPPYPMKKLLANQWYQGYTFRDANYNPDYPKTAAELQRMLKLTKPDLKFDGVISVNYSFLEDLLGAIGPVNVDGKVFSQNSLFEALEHEVNNIDQHNVEDLKNRKGILKPFASALIRKILFNPFKLRQVTDTIVHSLAAKEIQLNFENAGLQKFVEERGWSGAWPDKLDGDFLAVNEANLGGMKSDRYIQRTVTYHIKIEQDPADGKPDLIGDVRIKMYHYGIENIPLSGNYTGFVRTFVPRGAKLLEVAPDYKGDLWENDDGLYHVFGNIVHLGPGQQTELHYRYSLPVTVMSTAFGASGQGNATTQHYRLFIPKQSGAAEDYYTVIVETPQGMTTASSDFEAKENFGVFQGELRSDKNFDLELFADKAPPRVTYQGIGELGKIVINFQEPVSNATAEDGLNYEVKDLDIKHPEKTDTLMIDHIEHSGKGITLVVRGMTDQPEERYSVTFKNISDQGGNVIDPNPQTKTVVQRLGSEFYWAGVMF